ncbi:MAG TPA: hypothetical protein VGJ58_10365 [Gaiellaceae bacterium]|jgi:hypothetical protein
MRRFGWIVGVAVVALAIAPLASAKEFRSLVVVGARGDSLHFQPVEGLVDSFFDGASPFNRGSKPERRPPRGGYVRLFPLGKEGFVGIPGRFYPDTEAACFDWLQWRHPRDCERPNAALLRLLVPARRLARFHVTPTTVARLWQPRLTAALRRQLHVAFELAFDRQHLVRSTSWPSRCVAFSARWSGPGAESRPRRFCLSPAGVFADGRLYPLGRTVWSLVELNLLPARRQASSEAGAGPRGLPAPVAFETSRSVHTLLPSGRIVVARTRRERCGGTTWMLVAGGGACLVQRGGRIAVLRNGREVWRSSGRYRLIGVFAKLGPRAVAFSYDSYSRLRSKQTLLVTPLGGRERVIARNERPLGWTRGGELLTWRFRQGAVGVYLRGADGRLLRRLAARLAEIRFEARTGKLLMLSRAGVLWRHDGRRRERLADLRALGFARRPTIELVDGDLIGVLAPSRVAVLRRDGSLFASASFRPRGRRFSVAGNSGLVANPGGTAVAFTVTEGNTSYRSLGRESVYVLRAGDRRASRTYAY